MATAVTEVENPYLTYNFQILWDNAPVAAVTPARSRS